MNDVLFTAKTFMKKFKVLRINENDFHQLCKEHGTTVDSMIFKGFIFERSTGIGLTEKGFLEG